MSYKVGESYKGKDGMERKIEAIARREICYSIPNMFDSLWLAGLDSDRLKTRIKDEHGNPVKTEPDPPADKLYPVVVGRDGVKVRFDNDTTLMAGLVIGFSDGKGRLCIGFTNCRDGLIALAPVIIGAIYDARFYKYAIFRHHSLINQEPDE